MALNWYLIKPPNEQVSGFEDDDMSIGFDDAMSTGIARDVEIYNADLTICKHARAVVLNTVQDTQLKSLTRNLLFPIGSCVAGQYVKMDDRYWLIVGIVDNNTVYEKAILSICTYKLTWFGSRGQIIQRWANISSASQYNHGETYYQNFGVRSDQLLVLMPNDDETLLLENGTRFVVDRRCKIYEQGYDETVTSDTSKSLIIYKLTRIDNVIYDYQDSGHTEFVVYQDEQQDDDGYYVIDGHGYWLCQKPPESKPMSDHIEVSSDILYDGIDSVSCFAHFFDETNTEVQDPVVSWVVECDFSDRLAIEYVDNALLLSSNDTRNIGKSVTIIASADGHEPISKQLSIRAFI